SSVRRPQTQARRSPEQSRLQTDGASASSPSAGSWTQYLLDILKPKRLLFNQLGTISCLRTAMRAFPLLAFLWLGCSVVGIPAVRAKAPPEQVTDPSAATTDVAPMLNRPFEGTLDVGDLWHRIRHKDQADLPDDPARPPTEGRFLVFAPS